MANVSTSRPTSKQLRVGYFSDFTTNPLIIGIESQIRMAATRKMPLNELKEAVKTDDVDIALLPVSDLLEIPDFQIIDSCCVSTQGPSNLFVMYSRVFPGEIKKVLVDRDHYGSKLLAEMLLPKQQMVSPEFIVSETPLDPRKSVFFRDQTIDAWLVAGEHNFFMNRQNFPWYVDLVQAWQKYANLPYVLHCWAAKKGIMAASVLDELGSAANYASGKTRDLAQKEAERMGAPVNALEVYFSRAFSTRMDHIQVTALRRFAREISQAKVHRAINPMAIYRPPAQVKIRRT